MKNSKIFLANLSIFPFLTAAQLPPPFICLSQPPLDLEAGVSTVSADFENVSNHPCQATVAFSDLDFLPIVYKFNTIPCGGVEVASFPVPKAVPNGDALITWQCPGMPPICNRAVVSGGLGDPSLALQVNGTVGCASQVVTTSTALVTVTGSSTTLVQPSTTLITVRSTAFPMQDTAISWFSTSTMSNSGIANSSTQLPSSAVPSSMSSSSTNTVIIEPTASASPPSETNNKASGSSFFNSNAATNNPMSLMPSVAASVVTSATVIQTRSSFCSRFSI